MTIPSVRPTSSIYVPLLPHFPRPLPDELLFSVLCRLLERLDYTPRQFRRLLGFSATSSFNPLFPLPIRRLLTYIPRDFISEEELVRNNSILPFLKPFVLPRYYAGLLQRTLHEIPLTKKIRNPRKAKIPFLKFCPHCAAEDRSNYGMPYLRRTHQVPGVEICLKHRTLLSQVPFSTTKGYNFFRPNQQLYSTKQPTRTISTQLLRLAEDLQALPNTLDSLSPSEVWPAIHWNMGSTRLKLTRENTRIRFLHYVQPFQTILRFDSDISRPAYNRQLDKLTTPALALLCIRFGGKSPEEFLRELRGFNPNALNARPCLNEQCTAYRQKIIPDSQTILPNTGYFIFRCPNCEFAYLLNRMTKHREVNRLIVYSLGKEKDRQFCRLWRDLKLSFEEIRRAFKLGYRETYFLAHYLGLPMDRDGLSINRTFYKTVVKQFEKRDNTLEKAKQTLLTASKRHPRLSFSQLRNLNNKNMTAAGTVNLFHPEWAREKFGVRERPRRSAKFHQS